MYHRDGFKQYKHCRLTRLWKIRGLGCLLLLFFLIVAQTGCSPSQEEVRQWCIEACAIMEEQEEIYYTNQTREGRSWDMLTGGTMLDYWISGDNWMNCQRQDENTVIWLLCVDGKTFSAAGSEEPLQWQSIEGVNPPGLFAPGMDFSQLHLESVEKDTSLMIVTFTMEDVESDGFSISEGSVRLVLDAERNLREFSIRQKWTFSGNDGTEESVCVETIRTFHPFAAGEIQAEIQKKYQSTYG